MDGQMSDGRKPQFDPWAAGLQDPSLVDCSESNGRTGEKWVLLDTAFSYKNVVSYASKWLPEVSCYFVSDSMMVIA